MFEFRAYILLNVCISLHYNWPGHAVYNVFDSFPISGDDVLFKDWIGVYNWYEYYFVVTLYPDTLLSIQKKSKYKNKQYT